MAKLGYKAWADGVLVRCGVPSRVEVHMPRCFDGASRIEFHILGKIEWEEAVFETETERLAAVGALSMAGIGLWVSGWDNWQDDP